MKAFLNSTGIETLPLCIDRHVDNAHKVAEFLSFHPAKEPVLIVAAS
jgi:O-acetylhomoserine (thiol)-lyase